MMTPEQMRWHTERTEAILERIQTYGTLARVYDYSIILYVAGSPPVELSARCSDIPPEALQSSIEARVAWWSPYMPAETFKVVERLAQRLYPAALHIVEGTRFAAEDNWAVTMRSTHARLNGAITFTLAQRETYR